MSIEVKLELPMSQAGIDALLRDLRGHGWGTTARQIEEQLPKPPPPEPMGAAAVMDRDSDWWIRESDGWRCSSDVSGWNSWESLSEKYGPLTIYRPEPPPEAVAALVNWLLASYADDADDLQDLAREFARRLLGGDQ